MRVARDSAESKDLYPVCALLLAVVHSHDAPILLEELLTLSSGTCPTSDKREGCTPIRWQYLNENKLIAREYEEWGCSQRRASRNPLGLEPMRYSRENQPGYCVHRYSPNPA